MKLIVEIKSTAHGTGVARILEGKPANAQEALLLAHLIRSIDTGIKDTSEVLKKAGLGGKQTTYLGEAAEKAARTFWPNPEIKPEGN